MGSFRRSTLSVVAIMLAFTAVPSARAQELTFSLSEGHVTVAAANVSLGRILSEWTRVGHTEFIGFEPLRDLHVTLELVEVSESEGLRILLQSASGHMGRYRVPFTAGMSRYDRVWVLPTSEVATMVAAPEPPSTSARPGLLPMSVLVQNARAAAVTNDPQGKRDDQDQNSVPVPRFAPLTDIELAAARVTRTYTEQSLFAPPEPMPPAATAAPSKAPASNLPQSPFTPTAKPGSR